MAPFGFLFSCRKPHKHKKTHTPHTHTQHSTLKEHPFFFFLFFFFVPWQMWPLAVMVNPECWVWYKQDLAITMMLTSVEIRAAPSSQTQTGQKKRNTSAVLVKRRERRWTGKDAEVSVRGIDQCRMTRGLEIEALDALQAYVTCFFSHSFDSRHSHMHVWRITLFADRRSVCLFKRWISCKI